MADNKIQIGPLNATVEDVTDIVWGDEDKTHFNCKVKLSDGKVFPFNAHKDDTEPHGFALFKNISDGKFGKIGAFKPVKPDAVVQDPVDKLKAFLAKNPDVAALLQGDSK
jgi:hypothetical protein